MMRHTKTFPQVGVELSAVTPRASVEMQGEPGAVSGISTGELAGGAGGDGTHGGDTDTDDTVTDGDDDGGGAGAIVAVAAAVGVAYFLFR